MRSSPRLKQKRENSSHEVLFCFHTLFVPRDYLTCGFSWMNPISQFSSAHSLTGPHTWTSCLRSQRGVKLSSLPSFQSLFPLAYSATDRIYLLTNGEPWKLEVTLPLSSTWDQSPGPLPPLHCIAAMCPCLLLGEPIIADLILQSAMFYPSAFCRSTSACHPSCLFPYYDCTALNNRETF